MTTHKGMGGLIEQGLTEKEFNERYATEAQCSEALAQWRWPQGFICPKCAATKYCTLKHRTLAQCNRCRRQTSITANTPFAATKIPLTKWFKALYLLSSATKRYPTAQLSRVLDLSYNATWRMRRKIGAART